MFMRENDMLIPLCQTYACDKTGTCIALPCVGKVLLIQIVAGDTFLTQDTIQSPLSQRCSCTCVDSIERCISGRDRKSTRLNSSHRCISYAVFCLKKKKKKNNNKT